jgi:hypothetical protein
MWKLEAVYGTSSVLQRPTMYRGWSIHEHVIEWLLW